MKIFCALLLAATRPLWCILSTFVFLSVIAEAGEDKKARVLFFYDSESGLHAYDFGSKEFRYYGDFCNSDPKQHVRALEFAVRPSNGKIVAGDGQERGYPFYNVDLDKKHLTKKRHADGFSYSSMSFNPSNGLLYGILWEGPHEDVLAIIDPETGGVHKLGPVVTGANIAFDPDGRLYAVISGGYLEEGIENSQLYRLHLDTLKHELVGTIDLDYKSSSFTIGSDGIGYVIEHTGKLHAVDLQTAQSKLIGDSGCRSVFGIFEHQLEMGLLTSPPKAEK